MNCTGLKKLLEAFVETNCLASEYPSELDELLSDTAKTGVVRFSWQLLKPLLQFRLESVLKSKALTRCPGGDDDEELADQLAQRLDKFDDPPFTIQRVCELVIHPRQHYKRRDRYMRAMEKNLMVVSTEKPELTWMKSPRLTQLLEQPTTEINGESNHNHTQNHTPTSVDNSEVPMQFTDTPESSNCIMLSTVDDIETDQSVTHTSSLGHGLLRKRSSSLRDSLDGCVRGRGKEEEEVMGLVLQEADSTTLEHASHPPDVNKLPESQEPQPALRDPHIEGRGESGELPSTPSPTLSDKREDPELEGLGSTEETGDSSKPHELTTTVKVGGATTVKDGVVGGATTVKDGVVGGATMDEQCDEGVQVTAAKKIKYVFEPPREDGEDFRAVGGAEVEAAQRKETYKEAATGQMESDTPNESGDTAQEMMETS